MTMTDGKTGKALESAVSQFAGELQERHELSRWREIVRAFDNAWRRKHGAATVKLTTAFAPSKTMLEDVEKAYPNASITHEVKEELVGGAVLQVDDRLFDGSVSGQLSKLHDQLIGN